MTRLPRILVINPNTTESVTALVLRHVRAVANGRLELVPATAAFGSDYIASEVSYAVAAHAAIDCFERESKGCDGVLLACFGDPGLFALRELCAGPVAGLAEASMLRAARRVERFSVVTGGAAWAPMLQRLAAGLGLQGALASVRTVALSGGEIANNPKGALDMLAAACEAAALQDGASEVILGGAGLAGLARQIQAQCSVPVVDSVGAATEELLLRCTPAIGSPQPQAQP
jgi:allantoin racemase